MLRKNEDPRLSFSTPEFKEAQRTFSDNFKVGHPHITYHARPRVSDVACTLTPAAKDAECVLCACCCRTTLGGQWNGWVGVDGSQ